MDRYTAGGRGPFPYAPVSDAAQGTTYLQYTPSGLFSQQQMIFLVAMFAAIVANDFDTPSFTAYIDIAVGQYGDWQYIEEQDLGGGD